jgi:hypothetical protein
LARGQAQSGQNDTSNRQIFRANPVSRPAAGMWHLT